MATYQRETWVDAPLEDVWAFHSRVDGLRALTPDWMNLRLESVTGDEDGVLVAGSVIEMSVRPFDVGPRQRWTARIEERERGETTAYFTDSMLEGPFPFWEHTHTFFADGDRTRLRDRVAYRTPVGAPGDLAARLPFEAFFRYRHRRTRDLLAAGSRGSGT